MKNSKQKLIRLTNVVLGVTSDGEHISVAPTKFLSDKFKPLTTKDKILFGEGINKFIKQGWGDNWGTELANKKNVVAKRTRTKQASANV